MTQQPLAGPIPEWTIGDRLRKAREHAGFVKKQREFAEEIGISARSLTHYEKDQATPSRPVLLAWAMRTEVPLEWLKTGNAGTTGPRGLPRLDSNQRPSDYTAAGSRGGIISHLRDRRSSRRPARTRPAEVAA